MSSGGQTLPPPSGGGQAVTPTRPRRELLSLLDVAIREYQHAEVVVQARLYNFLVADSMLLLSWAAVYASTTNAYKRWVLFALALLSMVLGLCWSVMGTRHRKFLSLHTQIVDDTERLLPPTWRLHDKITRLQNGEMVIAGGRRYRLTLPETLARSRHLGVVAPLAMALVSLVLLCVSFGIDP